MNIYEITDKRFQPFGSIVEGYEFTELIKVMKKKTIPSNLEYVISDKQLEMLPVFREMQEGFYGGMEIELGYCMGHNQKLNALEYHRGSEVNVAVTDYIVLVGKQQDIQENHTYHTNLVEAFYVPEGLAVEFYATTLHYCACHINENGYSHATFLPLGTNCELEKTHRIRTEEDRLLCAKNKWVLAHAEGGFGEILPPKLVGENITIDISNLERE